MEPDFDELEDIVNLRTEKCKGNIDHDTCIVGTLSLKNLLTKNKQLATERDYYKARHLEFNNAFIEGGKKLTKEEMTGKVIHELGISDLYKED